MDTSKKFSQNSNLNISNTSTNTIGFAYNTIEQATLLNIVENFSTTSPNCRTPSQQRYGPSRASCKNRPSRTDQIRTRNLARLKQSKDRFVVARRQSARKGLAQFLNNCRRQRLAKEARQEAVVRMGVNAINNPKPMVTRNKWQVVGLPGLFDVDLLGKLTREDTFLRPMRTAIINKDVQSFNKLGAIKTQFWTKAAVVNNCVLIDNKLATPEQLRVPF